MIKIHITEANQKTHVDYYVKALKKKHASEGLIDAEKIKQRFLNKKQLKQLKRMKKHIYIKHLKIQKY